MFWEKDKFLSFYHRYHQDEVRPDRMGGAVERDFGLCFARSTATFCMLQRYYTQRLHLYMRLDCFKA